eukprot:gene30305-37858_t
MCAVESKVKHLTAEKDKEGCMKMMRSLIDESDDGDVIALLSESHKRDPQEFLSEELSSPGRLLSKILEESVPWRHGFEEYVKCQ